MLAEVAEGYADGQLVFDQLACGRREQRLAAVSGSGDSGGTGDVQSHVTGRRNVWLAGMKAHPYAQTGRRQLALEPSRRCHSVGGDGKHCEERLTLRVHLAPAAV